MDRVREGWWTKLCFVFSWSVMECFVRLYQPRHRQQMFNCKNQKSVNEEVRWSIKNAWRYFLEDLIWTRSLKKLVNAVMLSVSWTYWKEFWNDQKERFVRWEFWLAGQMQLGQANLVGWDLTRQLTALQAESPEVKPGSRGFGSCLQN